MTNTDPSLTADAGVEPGRDTRLADALLLGIEGSDVDANAQRMQRARALVDAADERADRAYAAARGSSWDPDPAPAPFGASLIAREDGDLARVLTSPEFLHEIERHHDAAPREVLVNDEDGLRYETWWPTDEVVAAARDDAEQVCRDVVARAGITPAQLDAARQTHAERESALQRWMDENPFTSGPVTEAEEVSAKASSTSLADRLDTVQTKLQQGTAPAGAPPARHDVAASHQYLARGPHGPRL